MLNFAKFTYNLFATCIRYFTAAAVVPCGGPKMPPRTSSIVQIIISFWSFEIRKGILRNQKIIIGLDSFSNQPLIYLVPFGLY